MIIKMILTNAFDPDPRVYKEAKTLIGAGHDVEILCWDRESKYRDKEVELVDGIKLRRFYAKGNYGSGYKQILGFLSFCWATIKYIEQKHFDAVHCHDFDGLFIGNIIKKRRKIKLVFDEHDLFYLYFKKRKGLLNTVIAELIITLQKRMLKNVDNHIVVTPKAKKFYDNKENITIITNAPMSNSFSDIKKRTGVKITIGFIGTVRYFDELKALANAARPYENIKVLIAGKGIVLDKLRKYIKNEGLGNVEIFGEYKLNQLEELYSKINITYLIYPSEDSKISLPNKFFESIITETPIIADQESEYGLIVKQEGLGWTIDLKDIESSLKKVLEDINFYSESIGIYKNNMKKIKNDYYWESNIEKLCNIYT